MKKVKCYMFMLAASLMPVFVNASDNGATSVTSEVGLEDCLRDDIVCKLDSDIAIRYTMGSQGESVLDLNGHTIRPADSLKVSGGLIVVERGSKLTINDSKGNGSISTGSSSDSNVWAAVQMSKETSNSESLAELVVNGGTLEGYYYGVVGNGKVNNTKITINGGTIRALNTADSVGIYQPQMGDLVINGGSIKGGTGIEIRSGNLTVNNGTIVGEAPTFTKTANSSGSTINGVGISVAQHTTKNPIKVTILGGNISGQYGLYEWNPHSNSNDDLNKVKLSISGGDFKSLQEDGEAVYSQNFTNFISGGKFNTSVSEYLTEDAKLASKNTDETNENDDSIHKSVKKSTVWVIVILGVVIVVGAFGVIVYKKNFV